MMWLYAHAHIVCYFFFNLQEKRYLNSCGLKRLSDSVLETADGILVDFTNSKGHNVRKSAYVLRNLAEPNSCTFHTLFEQRLAEAVAARSALCVDMSGF